MSNSDRWVFINGYEKQLSENHFLEVLLLKLEMMGVSNQLYFHPKTWVDLLACVWLTGKKTIWVAWYIYTYTCTIQFNQVEVRSDRYMHPSFV